MDWTSIIQIITGSGLATGLVSLLMLRPSKKKAMAEARSLEITNLEKAMTVLDNSYQGTIQQLDKRLDFVQKNLEKIEIRYNEKVVCIRQAYKCDVPSSKCPVLIEQSKNDCADCDGCLKNKEDER